MCPIILNDDFSSRTDPFVITLIAPQLLKFQTKQASGGTVDLSLLRTLLAIP